MSKQTFIYKDTLALDFYLLKGSPKNVPLLVLVHGGGFYMGQRDGLVETAFCREMAQKGFAVASISYRLTRKEEKFGCDCPAEKKVETFVMAAEDLSDAVHFMDNNEDLNYDREKVVLIGSSAGAETVLHAAFMNAHHDFRHIPRREYIGVVSFAGALMHADYITSDNARPVLMFHGEMDRLVPFFTDAHHYCEYGDDGYLILDGSSTIADRLTELGMSYVLAYDPEGTHDWADIPYRYTDLLENFIQKIVLEGKMEQNRFKVRVAENSEN